MRKSGNGILYSPSDLARFLESPFATWMDRSRFESPERFTPDTPDEQQELFFRQGRRHEQTVLARLRDEGGEIVDLSQARDDGSSTLAAMRDGAETIYQAQLTGEQFAGSADFLVRDETSDADGYQPMEAKLARRVKPHGLIQLCCYADLLSQSQARLPQKLHLALGNGEQLQLRTADYIYYYEALRERFLRFMLDYDPDQPPAPRPGAKHGPWESHAREFVERTDHLSRVARITALQIRRLEHAEVTTVATLAESTRPKVVSIADPIYSRLRKQARLQIASAGRERPDYEVLSPPRDDPRRGLAALPPPADLDVFFDIEGYPLGGESLEYLFGATYLERAQRRFIDWWAHDAEGERRAFEGFVDWVWARRQHDPRMHVYHYAAYETNALKRLMGKWASRENEIDELLRNEVFVDLYQVVRDGLIVGEESYSLKKIERLYRDARDGGVETAGDSIVFYDRWLESGEPGNWRESKILKEIRDYNRDDCDSTLELTLWLRHRQREHGIEWAGQAREEEPPQAVAGSGIAAQLIRRERPRDQLLGQLVEFHRREDRPMWWAMFERHGMTEEELVEDLNCLGGLQLSDEPQREYNGRVLFGYTFDTEQHTKLSAGQGCFLASALDVRPRLEGIDLDQGVAAVSFAQNAATRLPAFPPQRISLIPDEHVHADVLARAIHHVAQGWLDDRQIPQALSDFLDRREPRIDGHDDGPLRRQGESPVDAAMRCIPALRRSCLSIQGPPGSGKTTTAARAILDLIERGKRIGISANSHKAVLNLMSKCAELSDWKLRCLKVGGDDRDPLFARCDGARYVQRAAGAPPLLGRYPLVGGTAWLFSRADLVDRLDYLFIDEAGQVSVANLTGMSRCAANMVLLGDQMQLPQPIQGSHPGDSGRSTLDYLLQDNPTVPPEMGIFLDTSYRMHPQLCTTISEAFYEGRLTSAAGRERRIVRVPADARRVTREAGILFLAVEHDGNSQSSVEEVDAIEQVVDELIGRERCGLDGKPEGTIGPEDILVVAPYNLQVRKLTQRLPETVRVGTVDKFQGQEAPVVIVSMCASDGHASPRGLEFLLNPNRLNVALSRAQSLSIVVGHPGLVRTRCSTAEQMRLVNLYCRVVRDGSG